MSKHKKGKVIQLKSAPLSPEKYIKTQARALPIVECLVTEEWENVGICNIFIARQHITGNFTVGMYLIDLYCLGVKDTFFQFNITPEDYRYLKRNNSGMVKCEYPLVHNIIYGAIEFAEDYGFKPHKDFSVSQFILEEDDERVELIELDFGFDGLPCFVPGPNDDAAKIKHITATLERTAGPGNFSVSDPLDEDEEFDEDDEFDNDEEFDFDDTMEGLEESYARFPKILKKVSKVYDELVRSPEAKQTIGQSLIGTAYKITRKGMVKNEYTTFDDAEQEEEYNRLKGIMVKGQDYKFAIKEIKKGVKKYPDKPAFYYLLIPVYNFNEMFDEQDKLVTDMYKRFPGYLYPKIAYANLLIDNGKANEVLAVFDGKPDLNFLCPGRKTFYLREVAEYNACMCRHYIAMDNIDSADLYMNVLFKKKLTETAGTDLVTKAVVELCNAKMKKIIAVSGLNYE